MPQFSNNSDLWLFQVVRTLEQNVQALAQKINAGTFVVNGEGQQVITLGVNASGAPALDIYDSEIPQNLRVQVGELSVGDAAGDFGLAVADPATSTVTEFLPVYEANVTTDQSTSSTTYTNLATAGPSVSATIGVSGNCEVLVSALIGIPGGTSGAQSGGFVGVSIDGNAPTSPLDEILYLADTVAGTSAVGIAANNSASVIVTGLSPGTHTFECQYKMNGPGSVSFGNRFLQVRPF